MNTLPTVAHFASYFLRGTATFVYNQLTGLRRYRSIVMAVQRVEKELYPFEPVYTPVQRRFLQQIMLIIEVSPRGPMRPLPFSRRYFESVVEQTKPVIIHGHFGSTGLYLKWLKHRYYHIPLIVTFHGADATALPKRLSSKKLHDMLHTPNKILVISRFMKKQLIQLGADSQKIDILRVGINVNQFKFQKRTLSGNQVHLLHVSGFTEKKGIPVLIRAFARAFAVDNRLHLTLVGTGPDQPVAEQMVGELGIQDKVTFLGFVPNQELADIYQRSHIFVHPSITAQNGSMEGIPTVIMEAMATGMPVLATDHAGISELVEHGRSGYLSPENDIDSFAKNILDLSQRDADWSQFGVCARQKVERNHNLATQITRLEEIYQETCTLPLS